MAGIGKIFIYVFDLKKKKFVAKKQEDFEKTYKDIFTKDQWAFLKECAGKSRYTIKHKDLTYMPFKVVEKSKGREVYAIVGSGLSEKAINEEAFIKFYSKSKKDNIKYDVDKIRHPYQPKKPEDMKINKNEGAKVSEAVKLFATKQIHNACGVLEQAVNEAGGIVDEARDELDKILDNELDQFETNVEKLNKTVKDSKNKVGKKEIEKWKKHIEDECTKFIRDMEYEQEDIEEDTRNDDFEDSIRDMSVADLKKLREDIDGKKVKEEWKIPIIDNLLEEHKDYENHKPLSFSRWEDLTDRKLTETLIREIQQKAQVQGNVTMNFINQEDEGIGCGIWDDDGIKENGIENCIVERVEIEHDGNGDDFGTIYYHKDQERSELYEKLCNYKDRFGELIADKIEIYDDGEDIDSDYIKLKTHYFRDFLIENKRCSDIYNSKAVKKENQLYLLEEAVKYIVKKEKGIEL